MTNTVEKKTVSVRECAKMLGIGPDKCYAAIKSGDIPSLMLGARYRVPLPALEAMLSGGTAKAQDSSEAE